MTTTLDPSRVAPLAVASDGNLVSSAAFTTMCAAIKAQGIDAVWFTNQGVTRDAGILPIAQGNGVQVLFAPTIDLTTPWLKNASVPATIENARIYVQPVLTAIGGYDCVLGYNAMDDALSAYTTKLALTNQAFAEGDPSRPSLPVVVSPNESTHAGAGRFLTYVYPAKRTRQPMDWEFISPRLNRYAHQLRKVARDKPLSTPLWVYLQAHGVGSDTVPGAPITQLRTPVPEELRLQSWVSLGEGAVGQGVFLWETEQWWTGLRDSPALLSMWATQVARLKPIRPTTYCLRRSDVDRFDLAGTGNRYVSTLTSQDGTRLFCVLANATMASQPLIPSGIACTGTLRDLETGTRYPLGSTAFDVDPGDGRIFELVDACLSPITQPAPTELLVNGGFEVGTTTPTSWGGASTNKRAPGEGRGGGAAFKVVAPQATTYSGQTISVQPSTVYTYSYWIKADAAVGSGMSLRVAQIGGDAEILQLPWVTGTCDWTRVTGTFMSPMTATSLRIDLQFSLAAGTVWADDLSVQMRAGGVGI